MRPSLKRYVILSVLLIMFVCAQTMRGQAKHVSYFV